MPGRRPNACTIVPIQHRLCSGCPSRKNGRSPTESLYPRTATLTLVTGVSYQYTEIDLGEV